MSNCRPYPINNHPPNQEWVPVVILLIVLMRSVCFSVQAIWNPSFEYKGYIPFSSGLNSAYGNVNTLCSNRRWRSGSICVRIHRPIRSGTARGVHNIAPTKQNTMPRQVENSKEQKFRAKSSNTKFRNGPSDLPSAI